MLLAYEKRLPGAPQSTSCGDEISVLARSPRRVPTSGRGSTRAPKQNHAFPFKSGPSAPYAPCAATPSRTATPSLRPLARHLTMHKDDVAKDKKYYRPDDESRIRGIVNEVLGALLRDEGNELVDLRNRAYTRLTACYVGLKAAADLVFRSSPADLAAFPSLRTAAQGAGRAGRSRRPPPPRRRSRMTPRPPRRATGRARRHPPWSSPRRECPAVASDLIPRAPPHPNNPPTKRPIVALMKRALERGPLVFGPAADRRGSGTGIGRFGGIGGRGARAARRALEAIEPALVLDA